MRETSVNGRAGKSGASLSQMFLFIWEGGLGARRLREAGGEGSGGRRWRETGRKNIAQNEE